MNTGRLFAIAALLASTTLSANALPITFFGEDLGANGGPTPNSDAARTSFFSNLTGVGTETFDSLATGASNPVLNFPGAGTATFTGGGSVVGAAGAGRFAISAPNFYETTSALAGMTFGAPIAAFGFYATDVGDFGGQLTLTLTDIFSNVTVVNVPNTIGSNGSTDGSALYFGFYDLTTQYVSVAFGNNSAGSDVFGFDNLSIGSTQQVTPLPEPITLGLFGAGLAGLAIARRRRKA
jgi:hypothetical protein